MQPTRIVMNETKQTFTHDSDVELATPGVPAMSRTTQRMKELGIDVANVEVEPELQNFKPQITIEEYLQQYKACSTEKEYEKLRQTILNEENMYRRLYAKKNALKNADYLKDKDFFMIPAFGNEDAFKAQDKSCLNNEVPIAFPLNKRREAGSLAISTKAEFERNWRIFSERILDIVNWDNVFVAGGSILACMLPVPSGASKNFKTLRKYYHEDVYSGSDIDLFIYGLDEEEGKNKLKEIYEAVCNEIPYNVLAFRSAYAISIVSQFPYRHIQIILRLYSSPAEILMGFDVDSCAIGYDGKQVYMMPRCHQALVRQRNTIDLSRRSPTYELRLAKYADRGFEIEVPQMNRERIDPMIYEKPWSEIQGLAKLLVLETLKTPEARYAYKERSMSKRMHQSWRREKLMNDPFIRKRLEYTSDKASDYSTVFLPWGPNWNAKKIRKLMLTKDIVLNAEWSEMFQERGYHTHPCFVGTLEEVLQDMCGKCPEVPDSVDKESLECFVHGPVSFIVDDPGRQSIGSFHPITDGDWTEGAYLNEFSEEISLVANIGDIHKMQELLEDKKIPVETKDPLGRTPLQIAVLSYKPEMVRYLISKGADITVTLSDTRNLLHLTAQYNHPDLMDIILNANKERQQKQQSTIDINAISKSSCLSPYQYSILYGHMECLQRLAQEEGLDFTALVWDQKHTNGLPLLALASHVECFNPSRATEIAQFLLDHGVSIASVDGNFDTVYHFLAAYNYPVFTEYLLKNAQESKNIINNLNINALSPFTIAVSHGNYTIANMLLDHGARFMITQEDLDKMEILKKHVSKTHYYGRSNLESIQQPIFYLCNQICPQSIELIKRYIKEGHDINLCYYNNTILDNLMRFRKKTRQEMIEDIEKNQKENLENLSFYKEKIESVDKDSWEYPLFLSSYNNTYNNLINAYTNQYYSEEEVQECNKFIEYLKKAGAKTGNELDGKEPTMPSSTSTFGSPATFGLGFGQKRGVRRAKTRAGKGNAPNEEVDLEDLYLDSKGNLNPIFAFQIIDHKQYSYRQYSSVAADETGRYIKFFRACYNNDIETVKALATPSKTNRPCVIVTCVDTFKRTPFSIAISMHHTELLLTLFDLLLLQYTPIQKTVDDSGSNKVSNYKLLESLSSGSAFNTMKSEEQEGFIDPNSDFSNTVNTNAIDIIFDEPGLFHPSYFDESQVPLLYVLVLLLEASRKLDEIYTNSYAFSSFSQPAQNELNIKSTLGNFKYTKLTEPPKNEYPDKTKYLSLSIMLAIFAIFTKDEVEKIFEKLVEVFNGAMEKDIKTNNRKETEKADREKYLLYNVCRNSPAIQDMYNRRNEQTFFDYICRLDKVELIPIVMKYVYCGLEMDTVEKKEEEEKDPKEKRASLSAEKVEEEKAEDEEDEEEEEEEEDEEEEDEEYHYVDSDEEEMAQLNAFRNEKKTKTTDYTNSTHPLLVCAHRNALNCFLYLLKEQQVKEDIHLFMNESTYNLHSTCPEASVETLYNGTFKIMRTKKFVCQLFKEAVSHNSLKIVDYLTTHASDFNVTLKDLYEYSTDPEPKSSARAVRRLCIYSGMNGLTPVGSNALDSAKSVSLEMFQYVYTHYNWRNEIVSDVLKQLYSYQSMNNSIDSFHYLLQDLLTKKSYDVMIPFVETLFVSGAYGMVQKVVEEGFPVELLSKMSNSTLEKIIKSNYNQLIQYLEAKNKNYMDTHINAENESGMVPLEIICKIIETRILSNGVQSTSSFKERECVYNYVNNTFGCVYDTPKNNNRGGAFNSRRQNQQEEEKEDSEEIKELKRTMSQLDDQTSVLDTYHYVTKKIQTIPRTLVKYEDVQKKTKEDTKQANRASRYDDYYDEEDYY